MSEIEDREPEDNEIPSPEPDEPEDDWADPWNEVDDGDPNT